MFTGYVGMELVDMASCTDFEINHKVKKAFVRWIEQPQFDERHAKHWGQLCNTDLEAAMCEATFWAVLTNCGVKVEPNRDLAGKTKTPDFVCFKNGEKFYVEVTCIRIDTTTRKSSLDSSPSTITSAGHYALLNKAIFAECANKTPQCANLDAPCVLAIGTFHGQALIGHRHKRCVEWLVTGEPYIAVKFDQKAGKGIGEPYQATDFDWAAFAGVSKLVGVEPRRQPISALLVSDLNRLENVLGALHPNPIREFNPELLHRIPFCKKAESQPDKEATTWIQTPGDWELQAIEDFFDVAEAEKTIKEKGSLPWNKVKTELGID